MYKIHYCNRQGGSIMEAVSDIRSVAEKLERLFKARIAAHAVNQEGIEVGAVTEIDGHLTWYCENEQ